MHEVRAHADVAHDRHARIGDGLDDGRLLPAALHLDDVRAALLHDAQRIEHADVLGRVAAVRHGDQHHAVRRAAADRLRVLDHHVDGDGQRVGMTVVGHAERVADRGDVDAGPLGPDGRGIVRYRDHHDLLLGLLAGLQVRHRQAFAFLGHPIPR